MTWFDSVSVPLSVWVSEVVSFFGKILAAVFAVPILSFFAAVLLLLLVVGLLAALVRRRGVGR